MVNVVSRKIVIETQYFVTDDIRFLGGFKFAVFGSDSVSDYNSGL